MARTPGKSGNSRTRSSGSSGSRRTTRGTKREEEKKQSSLFGVPLFEFGDVQSLFAGPLAFALGQSEKTKPAANVLGALGSSPYMVARHPRAASGDIAEIIRGIPEGAMATYRGVREEGVRNTADLMFDSMIADYKSRYGDDWKERAADDPLFNFLDATAFLGAGLRTASLGKAFSDLGKAGVKRTPKSVWQESSRPGWRSEGETRPRHLEYQPPTGEKVESFQTPSRSPLRRGTQDVWDALAERYPTMPIAGARARISRANARAMERDTDRVLSTVSDPHAIQGLSTPLQTRLYWGAQLGDHSAATLKEFRDLLDKSLKSTDPEDLPPDGDLRETILEAKKRGFGRPLIKRLDEALKVPEKELGEGTRYARAVEAMRDATDLSERTMKDAHGFEGLKGDIRRGMDRLRGMDPGLADDVERLSDSDIDSWKAFLGTVPEEMRPAVMDVLAPRHRLATIDGDLTRIFSDRRNRVRDWRDKQLLQTLPERAALLARMTEAWGKEKAEASIALYDRIATNSGDARDWYRRNVGQAGGESAEDFMARIGENDALFQRRQVLGALGDEPVGEGVFRRKKNSPFYSPLQDYVANEMPPGGVQARQLPGILKGKGIRKEELEETGIITWAESFDPNQKIPKSDVLEYLSNPANAYNLEEVHRSSLSERWKDMWPTVKGLRSVVDPSAEIHQFIYRLPLRSRESETYRGKGQAHWGGAAEMGFGGLGGDPSGHNIVAHIRFAIVNLDGRKTMVVEEAQSDWLSQWLLFKKAKGKVELTPEQQELIDRRDRVEELDEALYDAENKLDDAEQVMFNAEDSPDEARFRQEFEEAQAAHEAALDAYNTANNSLDADVDALGMDWEDLNGLANQETIPKAPITEELLWSMAAKRIVRYAADNEVEQIVVPPGDVHRVRYHFPDKPRMAIGELGQATQDPPSITRALRGEESRWNQPTDMFKRYYDPGNGLNKLLGRELGTDGVYRDKAYKGRYSYENETTGRSKVGNMPGTVYNLSKEDWALHRRRPKAFKQQSSWKELPKGAMELLADGRRVIHLFNGADPSTAIHELGHTALYDLPAEDLAKIEDYLAGGRKLDDWVESDHEAFARAFEAYVRRGVSPTPELESAFQKLSGWMKEIWEAVKQSPEADLDPRVIGVFDNLLARDSRPDVDTFIPHRAGAPEMSGARTSKGIPRASRDIGDRAISRIPLFARNKLALLRMGMVNDDPRLLIEHVNRVVMLARANQLRETVLEMGEPLLPGDAPPNFATQYVVKKTGRGVDKPLFDALESADDPQEIRDSLKNYVDGWVTDDRQKWEAWKGNEQLYVVDKKYVDMLFKNVTGKTPGATTRPGGVSAQLGDAVLDSVRAMLLYLNPGFYTANLLGNSAMLAFNDPRALRFLVGSFNQARKAAFKPDTADPLWKRISVQMGRGPTSGGLSNRPPLLGRQAQESGPLAGRVAETGSLGIQEYGRRSGRIIDDAMRVAAWKQSAAKHGHNSDAKIEELLDTATGGKLHDDGERPSHEQVTKAKRELDSIRDEAEQLMLDFDSMSPFEKTWLTRAIFLYPFLKASAKWPFMALGERPIASDVVAQAGNVGSDITEQQLGERPDLPFWMETQARLGDGQYFSAGQFSPIGPLASLVESGAGLGGTPETGVSRPIDYLNPFTQLLIELAQGRSQFGQELPAHEIIRQDAPMTALQRQLLQLKDPSEVYADRSLWATLLRSLRFLPYEVDEPAAADAASRQRG